ncbi:MAG: exonuclease domain-containing protein [Thermomicrobiales bacterium]
MNRYRRSLRRAREWRWEPPTAEITTVSEDVQRRWDEARARSIAWAAQVVDDPRVVYLDTETTGFGPRAEIVDIAVIDASGEVLFDSLVRPTRRIPAEVIAIHGITDADVADAPEWEELYEAVRAVLDGRRIVVYNVTFDKQMIGQACASCALDMPNADWDCAMKKYAGFHGNWDPGKRWFRFQKLEHAVRTFGAEPGGHRAASDALACRAVVLGMAATAPPAVQVEPTAPAGGARLSSRDGRGGERAMGGESPGDARSPELVRWARAARSFMLLLESIPAGIGDRPGACGEWSARQVVAHCAGWEWEAVRRLRLAASHPGLPNAIYDDDRFNAASVAVRARMSWTATLDDLAKATAALANIAMASTEPGGASEWLTGRANDFEHHTRGLRDWLDDQPEIAMVPTNEQFRVTVSRTIHLENGDSLA